jgi:UDP-N-acetylmuramyl pentapeptide synthase
MRPIKGIKKTFIVDDTYNSSPASTLMALKMTAKIPLGSSAKRYAVLGDMLELGSSSREGHLETGRAVFREGYHALVAVGELSRGIAHGAVEAGMAEDRVFHFDGPEEAGRFMQERIKRGDVILVKGSQGARMEKVVKEIMADPAKAPQLLVRQEDYWQNR